MVYTPWQGRNYSLCNSCRKRCICVDSKPGQGTTFRICLPRTDAQPEPHHPSTVDPDALQGTETILLVEDEDSVRDLVQRFLVERGYTVLVARDADEAVHLHDQQGGQIHLLLTDVVLPGKMSGIDLAEHLRSFRPEMKILCVSGYTDRTGIWDVVQTRSMALMQKPFTEQSLMGKVRQLLDELPPESARSS